MVISVLLLIGYLLSYMFLLASGIETVNRLGEEKYCSDVIPLPFFNFNLSAFSGSLVMKCMS